MQVKIFCIVLCLVLVSVIHAQAQDEMENLANNWDFEDGVFIPWRLILKPNAGGDVADPVRQEFTRASTLTKV